MEAERDVLLESSKRIVIQYFQPVYFDPNTQNFCVLGVQPANLSPVELARDQNYLWGVVDDLFDAAEINADTSKIDEYVALGSFGNIVSMYRLRDWLKAVAENPSRRQAVEDDVAGLMRDVYTQLEPDGFEDIPGVTRDSMGFNAVITESGQFTLTTAGFCACVGPPGESSQDSGLYTEYVFHNIDKPEQMVSLYAGAGYLSWLARR